jgi:flagellar protein FliO/FliZ
MSSTPGEFSFPLETKRFSVYYGDRNILFGRGSVPKSWILIVSILILSVGLGAQESDNPEEADETPVSEENLPVTDFGDETRFEWAEEETGENPDQLNAEDIPGAGGIPFTDILTMVLVLAFVIALIYGAIWLLKKLSKNIQNTSKTFTLLASFALSPNKLLQIIDVAGEVFLISITDQNVNLISKIENKETLDTIRLNFDQEDKGKIASNFGDMLAGFLGNKKEKDENKDNSSNFIKKQKERLKNL